jgi:YfiH family protein
MLAMLPETTDAFSWVQAAGGPALVCRPLARLAPHLFTTRGWALGVPASDQDAGWDQVAAAMRVERPHLRRLHQVHGAAVSVSRAGASASRAAPDADIIIADDPASGLAIQTADCVPLLMADQRAEGGGANRRTACIAAAHAGWRGLALRVPRVAVEALAREFGSRPDDLIAAIGPSISAPRYEVGADVRARFEQAGFSTAQLARWFSASERPGHWYFDGWQSARDQLEEAGVPPAQIHVAGLCTATHAGVFCSYRRDGSPAGRMAAAIRLPDATDTIDTIDTPFTSLRPSPRSPADPRAR